MGAKVEKRPLTDNLDPFTDLYFSDAGGDLKLVRES